MNQQESKPIRVLRAGALSAAIWEKTATIDGRAVPQHTIRIEKRYRDQRTGEWKTTGFLRVDDLPRVALVASKAFEYATLREIDDNSMSGEHNG